MSNDTSLPNPERKKVWSSVLMALQHINPFKEAGLSPEEERTIGVFYSRSALPLEVRLARRQRNVRISAFLVTVLCATPFLVYWWHSAHKSTTDDSEKTKTSLSLASLVPPRKVHPLQVKTESGMKDTVEATFIDAPEFGQQHGEVHQETASQPIPAAKIDEEAASQVKIASAASSPASAVSAEVPHEAQASVSAVPTTVAKLEGRTPDVVTKTVFAASSPMSTASVVVLTTKEQPASSPVVVTSLEAPQQVVVTTASPLEKVKKLELQQQQKVPSVVVQSPVFEAFDAYSCSKRIRRNVVMPIFCSKGKMPVIRRNGDIDCMAIGYVLSEEEQICRGVQY